MAKGLFSKRSGFGSHPSFGVARGNQRGRVGIWFNWDARNNPTEVFRILVSAQGEGKAPLEFTYTFLPSHNKPGAVSLEFPLAFKEFVVGRERAQHGSVQFEAWFDHEVTKTEKLNLDDLLWIWRGRGPTVPKKLEMTPGYALVDSVEVARLKRGELKAASDRVRAEMEEKRRKAEEEAKARAEAARLAAEKAAADKAAAEKAAAAASKAPRAEGAAAPVKKGPTLTPAKCGIFFGSSTGNTEDVANQIKNELGSAVDYVKNVTEISAEDLTVCEILILGIPTWHIGELQDDWAAMMDDIRALNFSGKKVAIFGLGDGKGYPDTYVDAMMDLFEPFEKTGAKLFGLWPTEGYLFTKSKAIRDGKFLGVVIDIENQADQTEKRVKAWAKQIRAELGL